MTRARPQFPDRRIEVSSTGDTPTPSALPNMPSVVKRAQQLLDEVTIEHDPEFLFTLYRTTAPPTAAQNQYA